MAEESNHRTMVEGLYAWLADELTMGDAAALAAAQVDRITAAQKYFGGMLEPGAQHPEGLQLAACRARDSLDAYIEPLQSLLGRVLSFDIEGTETGVGELEVAYVEMKSAYEGLRQAEFDLAGMRGHEPGGNFGLMELNDYLEQFLRGNLPDTVLLAAMEELRANFLDAYEKLTQRVVELERDGLTHLVIASRDAIEGYSLGYSTMQTMEHAIYYSDAPLLQNCQRDISTAIEYLSRAKALCDEAGSEDELLDMQESYDVYSDPAYTESLADVARKSRRKAA